MFTGIVEQLAEVSNIEDRDGLRTIEINSSLAARGGQVGDSVAISGVCLTLVAVADPKVVVEAIPETLRRSNLGRLEVGSRVNLERPLRADGRFGGHLVQGHVDATVVLRARAPDGASEVLRFESPPALMRYIVPKGYVALDGISLTVVAAELDGFSVALIPHTRRAVTLGAAPLGYAANLEVDILAKYAERLMTNDASAGAARTVSMRTLREAGFQVDELA